MVDLVFPSMMFRSTGSYEPDPVISRILVRSASFDPQALTSLTKYCVGDVLLLKSFDPQALTSLTDRFQNLMFFNVSFDPQALTSLTSKGISIRSVEKVSIHRLLRA